MSSAIVHSHYFTETGLLAFIEFHSLYNLLIEVLVQVPGVVVILCARSRDSSALEFIFRKSRSWFRDQDIKVLLLVSRTRTRGLGLGLEFFKKVLTTTLDECS